MNRSSVNPFQVRLRRLERQSRRMLTRFSRAMFSWRTLVSVVGLLLFVVLCIVAVTPVRYNISIGMVPTHTITANKDVVDEITTEAHREAAAQAIQPVYVADDSVTDTVLEKLNSIYSQMDSVIQYGETLDDYGPNRRYSAEELEYARTILVDLYLRDYQLRTLLNTSRDDLATMYSIVFDATQNAMAGYVYEGLEYLAVSNIMQIVGYRLDTSLLQNVVQPMLDLIIQPNVVINQEATEEAREKARAEVEPVIYKQGQNIVVKGEGRVERYQYEMLSSLGLLSGASINISIYLGAALLVILTLSVALSLFRLLRKDIVYDVKRLVLLFIILLLTYTACILVRLYNIYLAPVALSALLLSAMLGPEAGLLFNAAMTVLVAALAAGGNTSYTSEMIQIISCYLCSGTIGAALVYKRSNRIRIILVGVVMSAFNFIVMMALGWMTSSSMETVVRNALWLMAGGAISAALCIAIQPLLELVFNLPTPTKLMDLSNPNHPLLHRLLLEAPGTYHHSIVVSSLAEAAAEAVGANPLLARVGGYYHDVGKLRRPLYFKENQLGGENKLIETDPYTAAQIVISHARDGATLARQYHLPREVVRIIQEHHGNTPVMYFYSQALKEADGKPVDVADFRYDANPPATKEGAIVLLCDTIEAAVRSMQNPTPEAIESFIIKLIRGKLQDGQLSNSPLTLKDIDDICHACATVLNGVFHERIEYPDPPDKLPKEEKPAEEAPSAPAPEPDQDLIKPWDGLDPESFPSDDADMSRKPDSPLTNVPPINRAPQIPIDPSEFEPVAPLPVVELPVPEAIPSVEEVMESLPDPATQPVEEEPAAEPDAPETNDEETP